jgi:hypothetical protein
MAVLGKTISSFCVRLVGDPRMAPHEAGGQAGEMPGKSISAA